MARTYGYLFEARGLQHFILASGRLRDAVGASDLLVRIASGPEHDGGVPGDLVEAVAKQCNVEDAAFSRRASGAFCVNFDTPEQRDRFRALWRMTLAAALPGLDFADAVADNASEEAAVDTAYNVRAGIRENASAHVLPPGGVATRFAPRSGRPSVALDDDTRRDWRLTDDDDRSLDQVLLPIRRRGKTPLQLRVEGSAKRPGSVVLERYDSLARRVLPEDFTAAPSQPRDGKPPLLLPRNLAEEPPGHLENGDESEDNDSLHNPLFPFAGERNLAVVHADLSGLGQIYLEWAHGRPVAERRTLSRRIESVVLGATRDAVGWLIRSGGAVERVYNVDWSKPVEWRAHHSRAAPERVKPDTVGTATARIAAFRPLVAGGDDVTFLVRSDLAVEFAKVLLEQIEIRAREEACTGEKPLPLSACAGVALVKAATPFLMAHELADQLCKDAKRAAKAKAPGAGIAPLPYPSAITFHSPTGSLGESYGDVVLDTELTAGDVRLAGGPYCVGGHRVSPPLDHLFALVDALGTHKGLGALRDLRAVLFDAGRSAAEEKWQRWWTVQKGRDADLTDLATALRSLEVGEPEKSFITEVDPAQNDAPPFRTALFDALILLALRGRKAPADAADAQQMLEAAQ